MKRSAGLDIIRSAAIFFVVSVHFFLNTKYYYWPLTGLNMFVQTFMLWTFMICVPLFMMLTGYLQSRKELSFGYFKGIIPILCVYLFYSIASILVRQFYFHDNHTSVQWISQIFRFEADSYTWYINMYIGLFLLIPFLNMVASSIKNKSEYWMLLLVLVFLTAMPTFFNNIKSVFPNWWMSFYPITYYFLGAYIKKFQVKVNKAFAGALFVLTIFVETFLTVWFSKGGAIVWVVGDYGSVLVMAGAVLFFLIFYDTDISNRMVKGAVTWISLLSLDIYLCSYITDRFVYKYVMEKVFVSQNQIVFYWAFIVLTTFISAALLSLCRYKVSKLGGKLFFKLREADGTSKDISQ